VNLIRKDFLMAIKKCVFVIGLGILGILPVDQTAFAESTPVLEAQGRTLTKAMAHYARSRQLLVAALREFDKGFQAVSPEVIFDGEEFRHSILERTEELEKLLAPQARIDRSGVQFDPHPAFLAGSGAN
jgi:hypothetical protein